MTQRHSGANGGQAAAPAAPQATAPAQPDGLHDVAALLAEQLSACHTAAARCFAIAQDEEDFEIGARLDALKLATRLVQASAAAASAVKRLKGGEFHHHVTVSRIDYPAEKAARKAREKAARAGDNDKAYREFMKDLNRRIQSERAKLTPEEEATMNRIWDEARKRHSSISRNQPDAGEAASDEDREAA